MGYEVAPHPRLYALFRLFGRRLTVHLETLQWKDSLLPTTETYHKKCFAPIYEQFPSAQTSLAEVIARRLTECAQANPVRVEETNPEGLPKHVFTPSDDTYRYTINTKVLEPSGGG